MRDCDVQKPPGIAEAIDWLAALSLLGVERLDAEAIDRTLGSVLKYAEDQEVVRAAGLEQLVGGSRDDRRIQRRDRSQLDLPALAGAFGRRLHDAGMPVTPERSARFARALTLVRADHAPAAVLDGARRVRLRSGAGRRRSTRVFAEVFGAARSRDARAAPMRS